MRCDTIQSSVEQFGVACGGDSGVECGVLYSTVWREVGRCDVVVTDGIQGSGESGVVTVV